MFDFGAYIRLLRADQKLRADSKISNENERNRRRYYQRTQNQINAQREKTIRATRTKHK